MEPSYQRAPKTHHADLHGETVILHEGRGEYMGLQGIGPFIWEQLATSKRFSELEAILIEHFEVDEDTLKKDLSRFLEQCLKAGLIQLVEN